MYIPIIDTNDMVEGDGYGAHIISHPENDMTVHTKLFNRQL